MPVITVTAPPLACTDDELHALRALTSAVAADLGLRPCEVQASCVHTTLGVLGTETVAPWPLVVLHGRRRPAAQLADVLHTARRVVSTSWHRTPDEVWVQWLLVDEPDDRTGQSS